MSPAYIIFALILLAGLTCVAVGAGWVKLPSKKTGRERMKINNNLYEIEMHFQSKQPSQEAIEACLVLRREFLKGVKP